jgi:LemA protein
MTALLIVGGIVLLGLVGFVVAYNGLVTRRNALRNAWAQIDVQLRRRHDLIPNLVETVKGYAGHERRTLEAVTQARAQAMAAQNPGHMAYAEGQLSGALHGLFVATERYPDLKANQNFRHLQEELVTSENRIAYARQYYNDAVLTFNNAISTVPRNMIAGMASMKPASYFEAHGQERVATQIQF